jgi:O-methyltransferase
MKPPNESRDAIRQYLDEFEDRLIGGTDPNPTDCDDLLWAQTGVRVHKSALSMIGKRRMHQLRKATETALGENVPGDFIETGVWRGGACMMMREILKAYGETTRKVYVADSFCGLPKPNPEKYPADLGDQHYTFTAAAIPIEEVKKNFILPDPQVEFVQGWFKNTLPHLTGPFAVIRLDGDLYESTMDSLSNLYDKVSERGFIIVDDYCLLGCKKAVQDFWAARGLQPRVTVIDECGIFWRKNAD